MKITARINYDLTEAWETWAVEVDVPDDLDLEDEEAVEVYIREHEDKIEFVTMKDSGHSAMVLNEIEGIT